MRTRALAVLLAVTTLALAACGGDDREATRTVEQLSPLTRDAEKATVATDAPVGVVPDPSLGKKFYVLRIYNHGARPHVWGDLRETPDIPVDAQSETPGIERDGPIWRYAVSPGNGAAISFFTPLD